MTALYERMSGSSRQSHDFEMNHIAYGAIAEVVERLFEEVFRVGFEAIRFLDRDPLMGGILPLVADPKGETFRRDGDVH